MMIRSDHCSVLFVSDIIMMQLRVRVMWTMVDVIINALIVMELQSVGVSTDIR